MTNDMKKRVILFIGVVLLAAILLTLYLGDDKGTFNYCGSFSDADCPANCVVCPPCPECSSISCQTEEFCESIGFNRTWYEDIQKRMEKKS
jgi:hypothetical protein